MRKATTSPRVCLHCCISPILEHCLSYMLSDSYRRHRKWRSRPSSTAPPGRVYRVRCGPGKGFCTVEGSGPEGDDRERVWTRKGGVTLWGCISHSHQSPLFDLIVLFVFPALTGLPSPLRPLRPLCQVRTSSGMFLTKGQDDVVKRIEKRVAQVTMIPLGEKWG